MSIAINICGKLVDKDGNPVPSRELEFYKSTDGVNYQLIGRTVTDENGVACVSDYILPYITYFYKVTFSGNGVYCPSEQIATYSYVPEIWQPFIQGIVGLIIITIAMVGIFIAMSLIRYFTRYRHYV